jgi:hypothetical protein
MDSLHKGENDDDDDDDDDKEIIKATKLILWYIIIRNLFLKTKRQKC